MRATCRSRSRARALWREDDLGHGGLNNAGTVAFYSWRGGRYGIYRSTPTGPVVVYDQDSPYGLLRFDCCPQINDAGTVAFKADRNGPPGI